MIYPSCSTGSALWLVIYKRSAKPRGLILGESPLCPVGIPANKYAR